MDLGRFDGQKRRPKPAPKLAGRGNRPRTPFYLGIAALGTAVVRARSTGSWRLALGHWRRWRLALLDCPAPDD